jgi:hypothetical protein
MSALFKPNCAKLDTIEGFVTTTHFASAKLIFWLPTKHYPDYLPWGISKAANKVQYH